MSASVPISFEFFPPNTPVGSEKLKTVVQDLAAARPEFFSVTYGAGGSTREKTLSTVRDIAAMGFDAAPHLSCVGSTEAGIAETLATYRAQGIHRLVALRGDLPSGTATAGEFRHAADLVAFIRRTQGSDWRIEVAGYPEYHPQQRYARRDLEYFAAKVRAGADSAITQFFYNADAYFHFVDEVRAWA
jgi:methylenetetrahydrofolate reductase (NADPH)